MADDRSNTIKSLRDLADWFEANPEVEVPSSPSFIVYQHEEDFRRTTRQIGYAEKGTDDKFFFLTKEFGSITVSWFTDRDAVCVPRVIGYETVEVTDPEAPKVPVSQPVLEWDCEPLLGND